MGSTRAGEGAGDGAVARCSLPLGVVSVAAAALRKKEERAASVERERGESNEARVSGG